MEIIETSEGVGGLLRGVTKATRDSTKIMFIGTPGFCTPFAELVSYALRKNPKELGFIANDNVEDAKAIVSTQLGMQLGNPIDYHADTVVLLGGLSMPDIGLEIEVIKGIMDRIFEGSDKRVLIGICFQSMFEVRGWTESLTFDYLFDTDMSVSLKKTDLS